MSEMPQGAQLSDDGNYWWDGASWQLVPGADAAAGAAAPAGSEAPAGGGDVTADDLTPVGDTGVEPGDESKLDERLKPYFEPDYDSVEDDTSYAEQAEAMDDSQYTGSSGTSSSSQSSAGESGAAGESPSPEGGN
jgi:hypothetical protein